MEGEICTNPAVSSLLLCERLASKALLPAESLLCSLACRCYCHWSAPAVFYQQKILCFLLYKPSSSHCRYDFYTFAALVCLAQIASRYPTLRHMSCMTRQCVQVACGSTISADSLADCCPMHVVASQLTVYLVPARGRTCVRQMGATIKRGQPIYLLCSSLR